MNAKLRDQLLDLGTIVGAAGFVYGLWLAWRPLGFIVGGLLLAAGCWLGSYGAERMSALGRKGSNSL